MGERVKLGSGGGPSLGPRSAARLCLRPGGRRPAPGRFPGPSSLPVSGECLLPASGTPPTATAQSRSVLCAEASGARLRPLCCDVTRSPSCQRGQHGHQPPSGEEADLHSALAQAGVRELSALTRDAALSQARPLIHVPPAAPSREEGRQGPGPGRGQSSGPTVTQHPGSTLSPPGLGSRSAGLWEVGIYSRRRRPRARTAGAPARASSGLILRPHPTPRPRG